MPRSALWTFMLLAGIGLGSLNLGTGHAIGQDAAVRLWKDATGNFQVRASLIDQSDTTVRLRTEDARELAVPINRLSQADQTYLRSLDAPQDNPFSGGRTSDEAKPADDDALAMPADGSMPSGPRGLTALGESASAGPQLPLPDTGTTLDLASADATQAFLPDPGPSPPAIPTANVKVSPMDAYDSASSPVLVDAAEGVVLVSIRRILAGKPEETRGRIYSVNLKSRATKLLWDEPHALQILDHDAASNRTLIVEKLNQLGHGGELVMLQQSEAGKPQVLYRRTLPGADRPGFAPQVKWARLLSGSHVAAIVDSVLYVWDLPAAKLIYRVEKVDPAAPPALSGNLRYLAVPISGGAVVIDAATGEARSTVGMSGSLTPGVAFHPGGRLITLCAGNRYLLWDCVGNRVVAEATTTAQLGAHPIHWIAAKMFRSSSGDVVHTDLGMAVWKYYIGASADPLVVGNTLLSVSKSQECVVTSIKVPHAAAEAMVGKIMRAGDAAMLVRPGTSVAISVEAAVQNVDQADIEAALTQAAEKAGWTVNEKAPITLVAKISRGEPQKLSYRSLTGPDRTESTASITPFVTELEIRRGDAVLWTRGTTNHVPSLLRLEKGETVQDAVSRYERPNPEFFAHLNLPPIIAKPEIADQVGMSSLKDGKWQDIDPKVRQNARPGGNLPLRRPGGR